MNVVYEMLPTKISKDNKKKTTKTKKDANVHLAPSSISKLGGLLRHSSEKKVRNTDCSIIGVFYFFVSWLLAKVLSLRTTA